MNEISTFNIYRETAELLNDLDDPEIIGKIILKIFRAGGLEGDQPELNKLEEFAYRSVKSQIERYETRRKTKIVNGSKGGKGGRPSDALTEEGIIETEEEPNDNLTCPDDNLKKANDNLTCPDDNLKKANDNLMCPDDNLKKANGKHDIRYTNTIYDIRSTNTVNDIRCTNTNTELPPAGADGGKCVGRAENTYPPKSKRNVRKESKLQKTQLAEFVSMTNEEYASLVTKLGEQGAKRCVEILDNYKGASGKKYDSDYRAVLNWVVKRYEEEQGKALGARGSHSYDLSAYEALAVNVPKTAGETKSVPSGQEDKSPSNGWENFDQLAVNRAFQPQRNEDGGT